MTKQELREAFLKRRAMLDQRLLKLMQYDFKDQLKSVMQSLTSIKKVGIYYPINQEIDIRFLEDEYETYYPKVHVEGIVFYKNTYTFKKAPFNTYEPDSKEPIDKNDLDAVIVPGLVFDDSLYRIGYGKGYFDAFLKDYKGLKIGVCYDLFKIKSIPIEPHDIAVDILVTNTQIYRR